MPMMSLAGQSVERRTGKGCHANARSFIAVGDAASMGDSAQGQGVENRCKSHTTIARVRVRARHGVSFSACRLRCVEKGL
jgi:hypothetical protein